MSDFTSHLRQLRKDMYECAFDEEICGFVNVNHLAGEARLSWTTVNNFFSGKTKDPKHQTIWKLATAIKIDLELVGEAIGKHMKQKQKRRKAA